VSRTLEYTPGAESDIESAFDWYESQSPGLGLLFLEELARVDVLVSENYEMFPQIRRNVRRAMLRRFPYSLIIVERGDRLQVAAVFHGRRDPERWQRRTDA